MSDYSLLTEFMFAAMVDIKAGLWVYLVASKSPAKDDIEIEEVISSRFSCPQAALNEHCQSAGLDIANRVAIPVLLPHGLNAEDVKGFKAVRDGNSLHIEFTQ